jgi:hypothetical protein
MGVHSSARVKTSRRPIVIVGILFMQLLLMGAAFVGGRLFASQNQSSSRQGAAAQLPSQLPKESPAASGTVQNIQGSQITLTRGGFGGPGGPPGSEGSGQSSTSTQTQVTVSSETKYYKSTSGDPGMPGGQTLSVQAQEGTLADVKIGNMITVWGLDNGGRITAEVVYVQSFGR